MHLDLGGWWIIEKAKCGKQKQPGHSSNSFGEWLGLQKNINVVPILINSHCLI
jgi:hypothetical protein